MKITHYSRLFFLVRIILVGALGIGALLVYFNFQFLVIILLINCIHIIYTILQMGMNKKEPHIKVIWKNNEGKWSREEINEL